MDNQATLTVEIDALQKKYRETNDMVTLIINNLHDLNTEKQTITDAILNLKQSFVVTTNEIAAQKLEWIQQKTREEQDLVNKKNAIQTILDKEIILTKLSEQLDQQKLDNQEILNRANVVDNNNASEKVANQVILDEAYRIQELNVKQVNDIQQKINKFKEKILIFHEGIKNDVETM